MSKENRPYPDGICWDEAWRQRQRADDMETCCESLARLLRIGCKISEQDGEWWLWEKGGDGIISGKTLAEMIQRLRGVYVGDFETRYEEKCRRYMERTRDIDILGW